MEYKHISQAGTHVVKAKRGLLKRIVLNKTDNGAITIYDNATGEGNVIGILKASVAEQTFEYGNDFWNGLVIKTAAASDLTIIFE